MMDTIHKEGVTVVEGPKDQVILASTMKSKLERAKCLREQMLEREAREDYVESEVGTNNQQFLEKVENKDGCLISTGNKIFRPYTVGPSLGNVWKPSSMGRREI